MDQEQLIHPDSIPVIPKLEAFLPDTTPLASLLDPSELEIVDDKLIKDYGYALRFRPEDKAKYEQTVKTALEAYPENLVSGEIEVADILKFCLWTMWRVTSGHQKTYLIYASEAVDWDNPPKTKCNLFNTAFIFLFQTACEILNKEEWLQKYRMILIDARYADDLKKGDPSKYEDVDHSFISLLTRGKEGLNLTALDPYHTASSTYAKDRSVDQLFGKLDFTDTRKVDLLLGFYNALKLNDFTSSQNLAVLMEEIMANKDSFNFNIVDRIQGLVEYFMKMQINLEPKKKMLRDGIDGLNKLAERMKSMGGLADYQVNYLRDKKEELALLEYNDGMLKNYLGILKKLSEELRARTS